MLDSHCSTRWVNHRGMPMAIGQIPENFARRINRGHMHLHKNRVKIPISGSRSYG